MLPSKIVLPEHLTNWLLDRQTEKEALVFTNGVFDILHVGHVRYLEAARKLGAKLVVAVNTDSSVKQLQKGVDRPINCLEDRMEILSALSCVDWVIPFSEKTPVELLKRVKPLIYVKGGDYQMETLEETFWVKSWGGKSQALPFVKGKSTTQLINQVRSSY